MTDSEKSRFVSSERLFSFVECFWVFFSVVKLMELVLVPRKMNPVSITLYRATDQYIAIGRLLGAE